jgi:caffeoyl-CoA O-methyltransferase
MTNRTLALDDTLYEYLKSVSLREPEILRRLRKKTTALTQHYMQISPEQGQFMGLLVELIQAHKCLEIGTFTGYSALSVARKLPNSGSLIACDISQDFINHAKPFWKEAGVADKIDIRIGPAIDTLDGLIANGQKNTFDFTFIDADKTNYLGYFQRALDLSRTGGLICIDNVLWNGAVANPNINDEDTVAIRTFNQTLLNDDRISLSLLPIGDGLTLARKR